MSVMPIQLSLYDAEYGNLTAPLEMFGEHDAQARSNHCGQGVVRLAERGGVSPCEALAILEDRPWHQMDYQESKAALRKKIELWTQE